MRKALSKLTEPFLEAGAQKGWPAVSGEDEVTGGAVLAQFRARWLRTSQIEAAAFHPLGTCRVGLDPGASCLGPDQQAPDTDALYVTDGSAVPTSLGASPQVTLMALAHRAAEFIDQRLG